MGRFKKVFMDVWHFPQSVKKRTGYVGCLTMCDAAGGLTRYIAIRTESAMDWAMAIITHWIAVFYSVRIDVGTVVRQRICVCR